MRDDSDISKSSISSHDPKPQRTVTVSRPNVVTIIVVIVVALLAFWGGMVYQKHNDKSPTTATTDRGFFGGGREGFRNGGGFGSVTAISSTSITVQNDKTNANMTYAITSSTVITDNGSSATASSIITGETVIVIPSSSNSADAARIIVNPNTGGVFGPQPASNTSATN